MIYKTLLLSLALSSPLKALAADGEVDISGFYSKANEAKPENSAWAAAAGFDSSSFLYKSDARGTSSTTIEAEVVGTQSSTLFHSEGDLQVYTFLNNKPELGVNSRELYIQTKTGLLGNSQFTFGRKIYEWSKLERAWTMMSPWSPRYTWDELHPEIVGMTGLFYTYTHDQFQFLAFGSLIAIPELGTPIQEENHNIVSPNPFWKPLPTSQLVLNKQTSLQYTLDTPPLQNILLRPNFALRGKYQFDTGVWLSLNTGVLPVNITESAAVPTLGAKSGVIDVDIKPQFPMRNINTLEAGFLGADKTWELWVSGSYEQPFNFDNQPTWLNPLLTPTSIISSGANLQLTSNFRFEGAALFIHEQPGVVNTQLGQINVALPTRFPLKQGIKVAGNWKFNDTTVANLVWIQDLVEQNHSITLDLEHRISKYRVTIGGGADILIASSSNGWVGQYYGDDRIRGWLKYAF